MCKRIWFKPRKNSGRTSAELSAEERKRLKKAEDAVVDLKLRMLKLQSDVASLTAERDSVVSVCRYKIEEVRQLRYAMDDLLYSSPGILPDSAERFFNDEEETFMVKDLESCKSRSSILNSVFKQDDLEKET